MVLLLYARVLRVLVEFAVIRKGLKTDVVAFICKGLKDVDSFRCYMQGF